MVTSPVRPRYQAASVAIHAAAMMLLLWGFTRPLARTVPSRAVELIDPPAAILKHWTPRLPSGGGGQQQKLPATKGQLPKPARRIFVPPINVVQQAKLTMAPSILAPPDMSLPQTTLNNWGDPLAALANGSGGPGRGPGIGSGSGPSVGAGDGASYGPVYSSGGSITRPVLVYSVDPDYSEEARKAKYSGLVSLALIVDAMGQPREIHVVKSLGLGLDEKAMDAVRKWKFRPGKKDGVAVNVRATVDVSFRLL